MNLCHQILAYFNLYQHPEEMKYTLNVDKRGRYVLVHNHRLNKAQMFELKSGLSDIPEEENEEKN